MPNIRVAEYKRGNIIYTVNVEWREGKKNRLREKWFKTQETKWEAQ
jgi:hypothetical protein